VLALVLTSYLTLIYVKKRSHPLVLTRTPSHHIRDVVRKEIPYAFLIFVSLGFVTILYSLDVIIVKRLFSPDIAGLYSGIATIARIIFFATASISAVLLSSITMEDKDKKNLPILKKATILVSLIGGGLLILFTFFPVWIIQLLIGVKYTSYAHLLAIMSLYLFLVSLLNLFVSYLLALRKQSLIPVSIAGILVLFITLFIHHETPDAIIMSFTLGTGISLILSVIAILWQKK
jgi:O-antigen/teichoic acid export membrane protein